MAKSKNITEEVKKEIKDRVIEEVTPSKEEAEEVKAIFEAANQPVAFTDEDFKLGPCELDIRGLSIQNQNQVYFRLMAQNVTLQKQLCQLEVDNQRLMLLLLTKVGGVKPEELGDELGELITRLEKKAHENIKNKNENKA